MPKWQIVPNVARSKQDQRATRLFHERGHYDNERAKCGTRRRSLLKSCRMWYESVSRVVLNCAECGTEAGGRDAGGTGREMTMNADQERKNALKIMEETKDSPKERERRLAEFVRDNGICPGVVCKCHDPESKFCPRHGKKR